MIHPKSFYYSYHANNKIFQIDEMLIKETLKEEPESVFDFGTGTGKNLKMLMDFDPKINVCGLDLSFLNIIHARAQNNLPFLIIGDEYFLCRLRNFDVIITCSVLCHIENIDVIIKDFKEITRKSIIIAETNDIVGEYYYPHDYESYGFKDQKLEWFSDTNKATYKIYKFTK